MPERETIQQALALVPWMKKCGPAALAALAAEAHSEQMADGAIVAWRGRHTAHLLVVAKGVLELSITNAAGKRHVINRMMQGEVFGLIPVVDEQPLIHDACAKGAVRLVFVPRAAFLDAVQAYPELALEVMRLLCSRARWLYDSLAAQSLLALPLRVARVLMARSEAAAGASLQMSQADLADMLGVTRQSLNAELKNLERSGIVALARNRIDIADRAALERLAGSGD